MKIKILIPVFNDWQSVFKLLEEINNLSMNNNFQTSVLIVNDASNHDRPEDEKSLDNIQSIKILNMKKNQVHQRCIAAGLKYIFEKEHCDWAIVMDADGEDRPEELNDFFEKAKKNPSKTITGNRVKRSEGIIFKFLYEIHKLLTLIFTGKLIKFGNFTCLPRNHIEQLIKKPYLWNSYSSSIVNTISERTFIPSVRGVRYALPSKMNLIALVFHSFAIISVFRKQVITRSVVFFLIYFFLIFNSISLFTLLPILSRRVFSSANKYHLK